MPLRDSPTGLPVVHSEFADRDRQGRFISNHRYYAPAAPVVKKLRGDLSKIVVAYVARNQDTVLDQLARTDPARLVDLALKAANEADARAMPDLDPGAQAPVDLEALNAEAAARRAEKAAREASEQAHRDAVAAARYEDWRVNRAADLHNWALDDPEGEAAFAEAAGQGGAVEDGALEDSAPKPRRRSAT